MFVSVIEYRETEKKKNIQFLPKFIVQNAIKAV